MKMPQRYRFVLSALLLTMGLPVLSGQAPAQHPIDIADSVDAGQFAFLSPLLKGAEVVSLAESIHMTHEFPLARIGMVRWMNEHLGFGMLAMEGSPEDLWVSQDAFLRDPANLDQSTSGLFELWNTPEMKQLFAYEADTWKTSHPLYISAYDIQPGTGRGSRGARVFQLLAERLTQYASPPQGFDVAAWQASLQPLTHGCSRFQAGDEEKVTQGIVALQEWIDRAAPEVESAYPNLPHAAALRLIPENLRGSLALCKGLLAGGNSGAGLYKMTRDKNAAQSALRLKEVAPQQKLILWAHVSHLFYDASERNTSIGELLHARLGPRLYTIGTFAGGGSAIMFFNDWDDIAGYGRVWGVSDALKHILGDGCAAICFYDLQETAPDSILSKQQRIWFESKPAMLSLTKNFDGIIWVQHVHPPQMPMLRLLAYCSLPYWGILAVVLLLLVCCACIVVLTIRLVRRQLRRKQHTKPN